MLVRFDSDAGSVTMFGEIALKFLGMMGHSGAVPSAILARDIPAAVARLQAALAATPEVRDTSPQRDEDPSEPRVTLRQRAFPLIELLERSAERGADVLWDRG